MAIEFELKFKATEDQLNAIAAAFSGQGQSLHMETTYYDTPDGAFSQRFYTLRRRLENGKSVCTVKMPAKGGREECELFCDDVTKALQQISVSYQMPELLTLAKPGLIPVCGAKFHRTAITITGQDATLELALDKGILFGGGRELPLCEVEVELKEGSPDAARAYAAILKTTYGLTREKTSKFRRALALSRGE